MKHLFSIFIFMVFYIMRSLVNITDQVFRGLALDLASVTDPPADPPAPPTVPPKAAATPLEKITQELKTVMPFLLDAKTFKAETLKEIKDLKTQIENMSGTILDLGKKTIELGKKKIIVQGSKIADEDKINFCKYLVNIIKQKQNPAIDISNSIKEYQEKSFSEARLKAALNETTDAQGGYLVPEMFRREIWRVVDQASVAKRDMLKVGLTPGFKLPTISLNANVACGFVAEGAAVPQSDPTFTKTSVSALKLMAHSVMSNEVLEDEEVGLVDLLITLFGEKIGEQFDNEAFDGDGTNFTGVLQSAGVNTTTMALTTFVSLSFDNISDAQASLKASVSNGIRWYMHRTILNVLKKIKDTANNYIWSPPVQGEPGTIWGIPYTLVETMPSLSDTAAATAFLFLGNMKNYQWGSKGGMTVKVSDIPKILTDQSIVVVRERMALGIGLPAAFAVIKTAA